MNLFSRCKIFSHARIRKSAAILHKNRGIGLMEVMVSVAIAALTISTMITMMAYQTKSVNDLKSQMEISDFIRTASQAFGVQGVCTRNLQNQTLAGNPATFTYAPNANLFQDAAGLQILATVGQRLPGNSTVPIFLQSANVAYSTIGTAVAQPPVLTDVAGFYNGIYYGCNGVPGPCMVPLNTNQDNAVITLQFTRYRQVGVIQTGSSISGSASVTRNFTAIVNTNTLAKNGVNTKVITGCL